MHKKYHEKFKILDILAVTTQKPVRALKLQYEMY